MQEYRYILKIRFEWDELKNHSNQKKHGISFEEAVIAFSDEERLIVPDEKHSTVFEKRNWLIAKHERGVIVVVFTMKSTNDLWRIISARLANRNERGQYEKNKR